MPANWVFAAIPTAVCAISMLIYNLVTFWREQRYLHAVYDGDRVQVWRSDRRNKYRKPTVHRGRFFY